MRRLNAIYRIVQQDRDHYDDILADLDATMVDRYFCNFSLFQSLPDSWAIDQLFPDHAGASAERGADAARDAPGHHLRLGREDRPLRRRQGWQSVRSSCTSGVTASHTCLASS
jgi:hypothetical protein